MNSSQEEVQPPSFSLSLGWIQSFFLFVFMFFLIYFWLCQVLVVACGV